MSKMQSDGQTARTGGRQRADALLRGTLDLLILRSLSLQERHGYGVAEWIEAITRDELRIQEGTLYPALHRMEKRGWIESWWDTTENNRRAKYYRLTELGRQQLETELDRWQRYSGAMQRALGDLVPAVG